MTRNAGMHNAKIKIQIYKIEKITYKEILEIKNKWKENLIII